ncbi:PBP1A family penicillin-binding protein [Candidatus Woesebacteria bacterium]|nr:PBP1A family penicillin-binding protein [Candidatus Woesebacteria bacterium]MCD8526751.1 PBP1A family penicillin-binding protein [Candidatus Woesebacteria bacterium]MCD8546506.1 PBP1A family penicillin-binding protein [Candidatus Woesebacteria bacterium]
MQIIQFVSTGLFWLGYPFLFFCKVSLRLIGAVWEAVQFGVRRLFFGLRKQLRPLLHTKVLPKISLPRLRVQLPTVRWSWPHLFTAQNPDLQDAVQSERVAKPSEEQKSESDLFSYEFSATSTTSSSRFAHFRFELNWWWKHGAWRSAVFRRRQITEHMALAAPLRMPLWSVGLVLVVGMGVGGAYWSYQTIFIDLPSPTAIDSHTPKLSTRIYDRDGNLLYKFFKDENRTYVPLDEISPYVVHATLAIEDAQFYEHVGISFRGIGRAFWHNLQNDTVQGGSTITQQLVKNTLLTPERTWERKIKELVLALAVDARYSKEEILEMYLNEVNYGGSIYGVEEASQWFFGKSARDLSIAESALLAGLPVAPTAYSPFGSEPERAANRQQEVLQKMADLGVITPEQYEKARQEKLAFRTGQYDIQSPHFVMYVRELLVAAYGEEMVSQGGLEVHTTLDPSLQASAEAAVVQELSELARLRVSNGAALVTDPNSGEVLAMVGSRDYFDSANDGQVNVVFRPRQPGSSIKPLTYALAFEKGKTPQSTVDDVPVVYTTQGAPPYQPKNYDGQFYGRITLREALANSRNIPAVRLLAELGINDFVNLGEKLGITTWNDPSRHGLAMTLGSNEVTMYDMASVYGSFATGGEKVALNPITTVYDYTGKQMYRNPCVGAVQPCNGERVLSPIAAYQLTSVLSDNQARSRAFGLNSVLHIPGQEVAVKTGTTNSLRDNWTIGYTNDRVVVTWVGNNDNTPMSAVASGVTGASPIWNEIMTLAIEGSSHHFALPVGLQEVEICASTGTLPCTGCPDIVKTVMPLSQVPKSACDPNWFREGKVIDQARTARL